MLRATCCVCSPGTWFVRCHLHRAPFTALQAVPTSETASVKCLREVVSSIPATKKRIIVVESVSQSRSFRAFSVSLGVCFFWGKSVVIVFQGAKLNCCFPAGVSVFQGDKSNWFPGGAILLHSHREHAGVVKQHTFSERKRGNCPT